MVVDRLKWDHFVLRLFLFRCAMLEKLTIEKGKVCTSIDVTKCVWLDMICRSFSGCEVRFCCKWLFEVSGLKCFCGMLSLECHYWRFTVWMDLEDPKGNQCPVFTTLGQSRMKERKSGCQNLTNCPKSDNGKRVYHYHTGRSNWWYWGKAWWW